MPSVSFPHTESWFASRGWSPLSFQREVWDAYLRGDSGLVHAATGTGKTLAAWWGPLLEWLDESGGERSTKKIRRATAPPLRVLWITPLRALAADTLASLSAPLHDLDISWTLESRTGDTAPGMRARQSKRLPTALVTTPESLTLLLTRDDALEIFTNLRAVVVDEWHELMGTKRGVQMELALARLRTLAPRAPMRSSRTTNGRGCCNSSARGARYSPRTPSMRAWSWRTAATCCATASSRGGIACPSVPS